MKNGKKGFTVAELLIVVAIIGILVAVSIPFFNSQLERSYEAADLSNMRSAKAAAVAEWMVDHNPYSSEVYSRNYDATSGVMMTAQPVGYGKSKKDSALFATDLNAHGKPNDGSPKFVNVTISSEGEVTLMWTVSDFSEYHIAVNPLQGLTLMQLHNNVPNSVREAADQATLRAIGNDILSKGWTRQQLIDNLRIPAPGNSQNIIRIADYYVQKTGDFASTYELSNFKLTSTQKFLSVLDDIGYNGGVKTVNSDTETLFSNSLFYSDQLAANKYKNYTIDKTMRSIIIQNIKTGSDGKVIGFTIYSKAMDEQANLDNQDKAKFSIDLTSSTT